MLPLDAYEDIASDSHLHVANLDRTLQCSSDTEGVLPYTNTSRPARLAGQPKLQCIISGHGSAITEPALEPHAAIAQKLSRRAAG